MGNITTSKHKSKHKHKHKIFSEKILNELSSPLKKSFYRKDWKFFRIDKEFYDFFI